MLGIIITVSVLVAAGIAVYESPQFRRWVDQSRRKLAGALYNLGDEIHPTDAVLQDISMTEEVGDAAAERRRKAREEIMQRKALMEARRRKPSSSTTVSFDSLVDKEGRLRAGSIDNLAASVAQSTALDSSDLKPTQRHVAPPESEALTEGRLQAQHELLEAMDRDRLHLELPSVSSHHPSESLVDLTPTSEFPDTDLGTSGQSVRSPREPLLQSAYFSIPPQGSSNHSEADASEYYYAHPNQPPAAQHGSQILSNPFEQSQERNVSSAPSVAGSLGHVSRELNDASSDGTLSEWGHATDGIATPASWSEIGSVVSSDDGHHH